MPTQASPFLTVHVPAAAPLKYGSDTQAVTCRYFSEMTAPVIVGQVVPAARGMTEAQTTVASSGSGARYFQQPVAG
jgi:hypothetical protein